MVKGFLPLQNLSPLISLLSFPSLQSSSEYIYEWFTFPVNLNNFAAIFFQWWLQTGLALHFLFSKSTALYVMSYEQVSLTLLTSKTNPIKRGFPLCRSPLPWQHSQVWPHSSSPPPLIAPKYTLGSSVLPDAQNLWIRALPQRRGLTTDHRTWHSCCILWQQPWCHSQ